MDNDVISFKMLLEKCDKWWIVGGKMKGPMLEIESREFAMMWETEVEAVATVPKDFVEMQHELMPMIIGDSYRRIFVHPDCFIRRLGRGNEHG